MDHRWGKRLPVDIDVRLACKPFAAGAGRLQDVSMSGAYIRTRLDLPSPARLQVTIEADAFDGVESVEIAAWIVRRDENGVGVEWYELAPAAVLALLPATRQAPSLSLPVSGLTL